MPPRKRKAEAGSASSNAKRKKSVPLSEQTSNRVPVSTQEINAPPLNTVGTFPTSDDTALLSLPPELVDKILENYPEIHERFRTILGEEYLAKARVLRSLSQVSRAYRNAFLPLLWDTIYICCCRQGDKSNYKTLGESMIRYANGLEENPSLKPFIRSAVLAFTRYKSSEVIPLFARCLESLPNLRKIHIVHTHSQMTTALKNGFEGVTLSNIRYLAGPGNIHEILKRCPNVTTIWNNSNDSSTLIGVIGKHCRDAQELRNFWMEESIMKRLIKAAPKLQVMDVISFQSEFLIKSLSAFKSFHTVILRKSTEETDEGNRIMEATIQAFKAAFKTLPPMNEKRRIRIYNEDRTSWIPRRGFYTEVDTDE